MKKLFAIRFGMPTAVKGDHLAIDRLGCLSTSMGAGSPFGVISIFGTDKSPAQVAQIFKEVADELDDQLPIIVWEEGDQVAANMSPEFFSEFELMSKAWDQEFGGGRTQCTLSLDELLELVYSKGMSNLSTEELTRLKELSKKF